MEGQNLRSVGGKKKHRDGFLVNALVGQEPVALQVVDELGYLARIGIARLASSLAFALVWELARVEPVVAAGCNPAVRGVLHLF